LRDSYAELRQQYFCEDIDDQLPSPLNQSLFCHWGILPITLEKPENEKNTHYFSNLVFRLTFPVNKELKPIFRGLKEEKYVSWIIIHYEFDVFLLLLSILYSSLDFQEYVERYADFLLNSSVKKQVSCFLTL